MRLPIFIIFTLLLVTPELTRAENKKGGFFNKEELDRGFFAEPTPTAEMEPIPTTAPTVATPTPTVAPTANRVSNADIASKIVKGSFDSIERLKALQSDPRKSSQILQSIQGVRNNIVESAGGKVPIPSMPEIGPEPVQIVPPEDLTRDYKSEVLPVNITVVIKAEPRAAFLRTLDKIFIAVSKLKVNVSKILVIGLNRDLEQFIQDREKSLEKLNQMLLVTNIPPSERRRALVGVQESVPNTQILLEKLFFKKAESGVTASEIISRYGLQSSPAWIIEGGGKRTIIQGGIDPREFLTDNGQLNPDLREDTLGGSPFGLLKRPEDKSVTTFIYSPPATPAPRIKKVLSNCTRPRIRRLLVGPATFGALFSPDILIFSSEDQEQVSLTRSYAGTSVAYNPMLPEANAIKSDPLMPFLLSQPLRCLPTRMHTVNVGGQQFIEFRQGEAAWRE